MTTAIETSAPERKRDLARSLAVRVSRSIPGIRSMVLYGSVARGSARDDSDVDILVLSDHAPDSVRDDIIRAWLAREEEVGGGVLGPVVYRPQEFSDMLLGGVPYARRVIQDGIVLTDDGAYAAASAEVPAWSEWINRMKNPDNKYIKDRFELAQEALDVAKLSHEHGFYWSAADRAYYCMFHSAEAALALFGIEPGKTHDGVINQFGRHIANKGLLPRKYHAELSEAKPVRVDSTYGGPKAAGKRQATHIAAVAERLLADVRRLAEEKRK